MQRNLSSVTLKCIFTVTVARFPRNSEGRLRDFLLNQDNYTSRDRPVLDYNRTVYVNLQMQLYSMLDLNERDEIITTASWMTLSWRDERMVWDPAAFEGINLVVMHVDEIWTPKIFLSNSLTRDSLEVISPDRGSILLTSDGIVYLGAPVLQSTQCPLDVRYFPFDTQICPFTFVPVNQYYQHVYLRSELPYDSSSIESFEWNLLNVTVRNWVIPLGDNFRGEPDVFFTVATVCLYLKRDPNYYITTIIIPSTLMCLMAFVTFLAPPDSGERISLGVSMVLGLTVFQLLIADTLPTSSKMTPILSTYLTINFILACLVVPLSLVNINMAYKDNKLKILKYRWIKALFLEYLPCFLCVTPYHESVGSEIIPVDSYPVNNDQNEINTLEGPSNEIPKKNVKHPVKSTIPEDHVKSSNKVTYDSWPTVFIKYYLHTNDK
ncbi:Neuronal acetylcholine receptor subunit alpha-10 [Holothuria leucospilota]|uniref:Neuronal acetylcholine receptor subunit alpha-10 n=1 Tax=Holothuria leucospilota TaxID=206669 RepID=A0A9Q0YQ54_HOLLE|nr:Neuronal acetylcholine receptor subunit alpha-10 [Holothuria leucospilota]